MMPELEKVVAGLESCRPGRNCGTCPYHVLFDKGICNQQLEADALALLKEQMPRVMTLEEIREIAETADPDPVFVEKKSGATAWDLYTIDIIYHMAKRPYMGIRVWTSRPTPEQMRDTPWEGDSDGE